VILVLLWGVANAHPGTHRDLERTTAQLEKDPGAVETRVLRAALYRRHGQHQRSLADLDAAAGLDVDPGALDLQRGLTLAAMGRHAEAVEALTRSIARGPSWTAHTARGRSRGQLGRHPAAVLDLAAALAIRPQVEVYLERGQLQRDLGRLGAAAAGYREGLSKLGPARVLVDALVDVELARGKVEAALAVVDAQIERKPATHWLLRRAEALAAVGDDGAQKAALERALALADRAIAKRASAINLVARARVQFARGAEGLAHADLRAALHRAPGYAAARALARRKGRAP